MKTLAECLADNDNDAFTVKQMRDAWKNTLAKCRNPKHHDYFYYGARGITVCERWDSFENFFADMGLRPDELTLERLDNDGNYEPGNCVWATRQRQSENRRGIAYVEWEGKKLTIAAWERELGWKAGTLKARLNRLKYSVEEAFTKPVKCGAKLVTREYAPRKKQTKPSVPAGINHPSTRLSIAEVISMREQWSTGLSFSELARRFNTTGTTAAKACRGEGSYGEVK